MVIRIRSVEIWSSPGLWAEAARGGGRLRCGRGRIARGPHKRGSARVLIALGDFVMRRVCRLLVADRYHWGRLAGRGAKSCRRRPWPGTGLIA